MTRFTADDDHRPRSVPRSSTGAPTRGPAQKLEEEPDPEKPPPEKLELLEKPPPEKPDPEPELLGGV